MSDKKDRNVFAMVTVMALPVILGAMFILSKEFKKEDIPVNSASLIIPDVDGVEGVDDGKAKIYRDEQTELMYRRNRDAGNIASDRDFFPLIRTSERMKKRKRLL